MGGNYTVLSAQNTLQPFENRSPFTLSGTIGKTVVISLFVGTTLLPISHLDNTHLSSDYSLPSCIDYVCLDCSREIDCLSNNQFFDLLKMENLKKIDCISAFQENWNGVGGQTFSDSSISMFKSIIESAYKQPNIAPTGRGSLLLQYELDDRSLLAFEVKETNIEMVSVPHGDYSSASSEVFTDNFIQQINSRVEQFYGCK